MKKMNSLKRHVLLTGAMLLSLFCLTGCHGSQGLDPFVVPEEFNESEKYEITFWAKNDTNVYQTAIYQKAVEDFEALYPNIDITIRLYNDYSKIYNDVITNISTNTTPNVCITYPDNIATYMAGPNTVVPLDELFTNSKYGLSGSELKFDGPALDEIVPEFLSECVLADNHYAIPYMRSTEALYINKDFVNALGYEIPDILTWDFVWEVADKAAEKNADGTYKLNGQNTMIPFIYKSTDNYMIQLLKQMGTGYSDVEGNILLFNDDTKEVLLNIIEHTKKGSFSTFKISSYPANFLNAGQCVFAIDSTAGSTWMGSKAPLLDIAEEKLVDFETVVRPIPQVDVNNPQMISQGPSICIFNKENPGEVLASWLFAQFLLTNDVQINYAKTEGYVPVTTKAQEDVKYNEYLKSGSLEDTEHYKIKIDATNLLIENIDKTFVTPVFNGSASLRDAAGSLIENVVNGVRRKQDMSGNYIDKLYKDTVSLYHLESVSGTKGTVTEFGPLPKEARILLITLACAWGFICIFYIRSLFKNRKK